MSQTIHGGSIGKLFLNNTKDNIPTRGKRSAALAKKDPVQNEVAVGKDRFKERGTGKTRDRKRNPKINRRSLRLNQIPVRPSGRGIGRTKSKGNRFRAGAK